MILYKRQDGLAWEGKGDIIGQYAFYASRQVSQSGRLPWVIIPSEAPRSWPRGLHLDAIV